MKTSKAVLYTALCIMLLLTGCGKSNAPQRVAVEQPEESTTPAVQEKEPTAVDAAQPTDDRFGMLGEQLEALTQKYTAADGRWAVCLLDTNTEDALSISAEPMESASLIKLFIAGTVQENRDSVDAQQSYKGETAALLLDMLSVSDNDATNTLVLRLGEGDADAGMARVNAFCEAHGYTDTRMGRLMLDFDAANDNFTSADDCCAMLNSILQEESAGADELLDALRQQQRTAKIPAGVPAGISTANKTGELDDVENDAAIVWTAHGTYILCVMSGDLADTALARAQIVTLSKTAYDLMADA